MLLWILRPQGNLPLGDDPWDPWYDKCFGFVVRAETESDARRIAQANAGDESRGEFLSKKIANTTEPWLDEKYTTCTELCSSGGEGIIMEDVHAA